MIATQPIEELRVLAPSDVPSALADELEVTGGGELLWSATAIAQVIDWLAAQELGILGGELYRRTGPMRTSFAGDWATADGWRAGESWAAYVRRGAERAHAATGAIPDRLVDLTVVFLAAAREADYPCRGRRACLSNEHGGIGGCIPWT
jgi:hypothetical protein